MSTPVQLKALVVALREGAAAIAGTQSLLLLLRGRLRRSLAYQREVQSQPLWRCIVYGVAEMTAAPALRALPLGIELERQKVDHKLALLAVHSFNIHVRLMLREDRIYLRRT